MFVYSKQANVPVESSLAFSFVQRCSAHTTHKWKQTRLSPRGIRFTSQTAQTQPNITVVMCLCVSFWVATGKAHGTMSGWCQRVLWASGFDTKGAEHWYVMNWTENFANLTWKYTTKNPASFQHKTTKFPVVQLHFLQLPVRPGSIEQDSFKRGTFPSIDDPTNKSPALKYSAANQIVCVSSTTQQHRDTTSSEYGTFLPSVKKFQSAQSRSHLVANFSSWFPGATVAKMAEWSFWADLP